jgi:DNA-directed RNA polymerase specialized sigma24 family protein
METATLLIQPHTKKDRAKIFEELYKQAFRSTAAFVHKMGGSLADAQDIFQDALVIFYEKNSREHFMIHTTPEAYILGISKHLWIRKFHQDRKKVTLLDWEQEILIPGQDASCNSTLLLNFLEQAGKKCLDLLRAFYYEKLPMNEIAQMTGYKNERSATVQKYKCLEKVRDTIKKKSIAYEDFIE